MKTIINIEKLIKECDAAAEFLIPRTENEKDPYWINISRMIFAGSLCYSFQKNSTIDEIEKLYKMDLKDFVEELKTVEGTEEIVKLLNTDNYQSVEYFSFSKEKVSKIFEYTKIFDYAEKEVNKQLKGLISQKKGSI